MWEAITNEWVIGREAEPLLRAALEWWDAYQAARAVLAEEGPTIETGDDMVRQHPAAKAARDAYKEFRISLKQLGLQPPD